MNISKPAFLSFSAIVILAVAQLFVIRYAYQLKYGELEFVYKNVYEYAKPFIQIQWETTDHLAKNAYRSQNYSKAGQLTPGFIESLGDALVNSAYVEANIIDYFEKRGLSEEVEFSLTMRNLEMNFNGRVYHPPETLSETALVGDLKSAQNGTLVYRHIANSDYLRADLDLFVYLPNRTTLLIGEMKWVLILSSLTFVLISWVAIFNLKNWQKQKRISAIKDDLIDHISHEFRTPIASINLASDSIQNNGHELGLSRVIELSQLIKRQGFRLQKMVNNMLNTAFLDLEEQVEKQPVCLDDFLKEYVSNWLPSDQDDPISLQIDLSAPDGKVLADLHHIESLLNNLIDNAIKHGKSTSTIKICSAEKNGFYLLTIKDDGVGISPTQRKDIFEKHQRFNLASKGLGLGLYHVHQIVSMHQGSISLESEPGTGTSFTISIPLI